MLHNFSRDSSGNDETLSDFFFLDLRLRKRKGFIDKVVDFLDILKAGNECETCHIFCNTWQTLAHICRLEDWTLTAKNVEVGKPACRSFCIYAIISFIPTSFKIHLAAINHRNSAKKRQSNTPTQEKHETIVVRKGRTKNNKEQANQNKTSPIPPSKTFISMTRSLY